MKNLSYFRAADGASFCQLVIRSARNPNRSPVCAERPVRREKNQILARRLGDQHTVERIAMMPLQRGHERRVFGP